MSITTYGWGSGAVTSHGWGAIISQPIEETVAIFCDHTLQDFKNETIIKFEDL
jgi:hypothetical protein